MLTLRNLTRKLQIQSTSRLTQSVESLRLFSTEKDAKNGSAQQKKANEDQPYTINPEDYYDEKTESWLGFDGDMDKVDEEGTPTWLSAVRTAKELADRQEREHREANKKMPPVINREKEVDEFGRSYGTGRRKTSVARVWIKPTESDAEIKVNRRDMAQYFCLDYHREELLKPFQVTNTLGQFDVYCTVKGGGLSGQAGAIRHGITRALEKNDPEYRPALKEAGFITRDPRMVERKKPGRKKARKSFQWVKR